jgi:DNA invertase Pin-like site-specific DNA recombinase
MDRFNGAGVAFVSVTQNFSTADAMGRLTLNMLMSFAEFEREMIAERTRDKIVAAR